MTTKPDLRRVWAKVEKTPTCWLWMGAVTDGYGSLRFAGRQFRAHRFIYALLVGEIPEGMTLDHLCRVRHCVNPAHLEVVTPQENWRRGPNHPYNRTRCPRGHAYDSVRAGRRICLRCRSDQQQAYVRRAREG